MSVLPSDCGAPATHQQTAMHCSRTHARTKCRRRRLPVLTGLGMHTSTNHTSSTIWSRQILSKSVMGSAIMGVMRRDPARREACGARTACTLRVDSEPPRPAAVLCKRGKHRAMQGTCQSDNNNQAPRKPLRGLTAPSPALTRRHSRTGSASAFCTEATVQATGQSRVA